MGAFLRGAVVIALAFCPSIALASTNVFNLRSDQANYTVGPNQTALIAVYLTETSVGNPFVVVSELGLESAGFRVNRVPNAVPTPAPVAPAAITHLAPNSAFNDLILTPLINVAPEEATLLEFAGAGAHGVLPFALDGSTMAIPLGVVSVTGGPVAGDVTSFSLADLSVGADTLSFASLLQLDPTTTGSFTVTVIPEPSSCAFLILGTVAIIRRPRRF